MNLWPTSLYPTAILGRGLRIGLALVDATRQLLFSSITDPKVIRTSVPEEATLAEADAFDTEIASRDAVNVVVALDAEDFLVSIGTEPYSVASRSGGTVSASADSGETVVAIQSEPSTLVL